MFKTRKCMVLIVLLLAATAGVHADVTIESLVTEMGLEEGPVPARELDDWRPPEKIVVRGGPELAARLERLFPATRFIAVQTRSEAAAQAGDADAVIGYCNHDIVTAGRRLVWVQIFSAGAERCLAVDSVRRGDILLTNMQKMASPVIAEHAIAMMLSLTRGLTQYGKNMAERHWDEGLYAAGDVVSIAGKTMLVAGLGGIGTEVARRGAALGMRVTATRNRSRSGPEFVAYVGLADELPQLAAEADVIVNALPLTPQTEGLFDQDFFDRAKRGHVFVNVGRGKTVVTADLLAALRDGRVGAAGLDVTEPEPLPENHPLWQRDDVIITPHVASTGNNRERQYALATENIRRYIAGERLLNVVDPKRGY